MVSSSFSPIRVFLSIIFRKNLPNITKFEFLLSYTELLCILKRVANPFYLEKHIKYFNVGLSITRQNEWHALATMSCKSNVTTL